MEDGDIERGRPTTAEVVGALLRATVGSVPGGAVLAEAVGLLVLTADRMDRAREAAVVAAHEAGGYEDLVDRLRVDEALQVMMLEALELAARTADARKRRLAGRVVGRAAADSARIDTAQLVTRALRGLDAPHLAALVRVRSIEMAHLPFEERTVPEMDGAPSDLQERMSRVKQEAAEYTRALPDPVRAVLLAEGLVREGNTYDDDGWPTLFTSHFGRRLLDDLEAEAP